MFGLVQENHDHEEKLHKTIIVGGSLARCYQVRAKRDREEARTNSKKSPTPLVAGSRLIMEGAGVLRAI